jgi:hypothetical protein
MAPAVAAWVGAGEALGGGEDYGKGREEDEAHCGQDYGAGGGRGGEAEEGASTT